MRRSTDAGGRTAARLAAGLAAILLLTGDLRAGSISFSGTTAGAFNNPTGGTSTGVGTDSINFGSPPGALSFTGTSFTAEVGQVFELGSIGYYNSDNTNPIMGVDLGLTLNLTSGGTGPAGFTLPIAINNTTAAGSADELTIGVGSEIGTFVGSDGKTYGLMVTGFGCGCGADGVPIYEATASANEGQVVCLPIHGQFAEKAPPPGAGTPPTIPDTDVHVPSVPEPATLVLAAVGLVTVGVRRWR